MERPKETEQQVKDRLRLRECIIGALRSSHKMCRDHGFNFYQLLEEAMGPEVKPYLPKTELLPHFRD